MKTKSDPYNWYQQEEVARYRVRQKMRSGRSAGLTPVYVAAAALAAGVAFLLLILAGVLPL